MYPSAHPTAGTGLGIWLTGKQDLAWVGAWVVAWVAGGGE